MDDDTTSPVTRKAFHGFIRHLDSLVDASKVCGLSLRISLHGVPSDLFSEVDGLEKILGDTTLVKYRHGEHMMLFRTHDSEVAT